MPSNPQDSNFTSEYAVDRVLTTEQTVVYSLAAGSPGSPTQSTNSISHDLGKAAYVSFIFSVDGTNFYGQGTTIYRESLAPILDQVCPTWVDASVDINNVYFYVNNEYNAATDVTIRYVLDNIV